jgi:hypothetical protein
MFTTIERLPNEILLRILSYLSWFDVLTSFLVIEYSFEFSCMFNSFEEWQSIDLYSWFILSKMSFNYLFKHFQFTISLFIYSKYSFRWFKFNQFWSIVIDGCLMIRIFFVFPISNLLILHGVDQLNRSFVVYCISSNINWMNLHWHLINMSFVDFIT